MPDMKIEPPVANRERHADVNLGPVVAPVLAKALRWLDVQRSSALPLPRQALTAVPRRPNPRHDIGKWSGTSNLWSPI